MARNCGQGATGAAGITTATATELAGVLSNFNAGVRALGLAAVRGDGAAVAALPAQVREYLSAELRAFDESVPPAPGEGPAASRTALAGQTATAIPEIKREIEAYVVDWSLEQPE